MSGKIKQPSVILPMFAGWSAGLAGSSIARGDVEAWVIAPLAIAVICGSVAIQERHRHARLLAAIEESWIVDDGGES